MAQVKNWQLGREMEYPYADNRPKRQFAAVFNLNRCIGCQTCTMACKSTWTFSAGQEYMWWNNVESKPYGGYPMNWDIKLLAMLGEQEWQGSTYAGKTVFEARDPAKQTASGMVALGYLPDDEDWRAPNAYEDSARAHSPGGAALPEHENFGFYLPRICNHCTYPACLAACPRKAIYKRPEDGSLAIKGRVMYYSEYENKKTLSVEYGIESYYVPEHQGRTIENARVQADVEVSVDRRGNSALSRIFLAGKEVEFE